MEYRQSDLYRAIAYQRGIHYLAMEFEGKRYAVKKIREEDENTFRGKHFFLTLECYEKDDTLDFYTYTFQYLSEIVKPKDEHSERKNREVRIILYDKYGDKVEEFYSFNLQPRDCFAGCGGGGSVYGVGNLAVCKLNL